MSVALEILVRHLLVAQLRRSDDEAGALDDLRAVAADEAKALCNLARCTANPAVKREALAGAADLARLVGEVAEDLNRGAEPIGARAVLQRA